MENGPQLVIAVGPLSQNVQTEIDFREGWDFDFAHSAYRGLASCVEDFCATRCLVCDNFLSNSAILSVSMSAGNDRRHSDSDFSHSAAACSVRPSFEYTSPRCW